jgi:hypothetical protein
MRSEQGHTTGCPVTFSEIFPKGSVTAKVRHSSILQVGFLESYTSRMVFIYDVPEVWDMMSETMAVPREKRQGGKEERKKKENS